MVILLLLSGVPPVQRVQFAGTEFTVPDHNPVTESERLSFWNRPASVLVSVATEFAGPKWVGRQQSVGARMPGGGMTETVRGIEDRYTHGSAGDRTGVTDPVCSIAPDGRLSAVAVRIQYVIVGRAQFGSQTDSECAFLCISDHQRPSGGIEHELAIHNARPVVTLECVTLGLLSDHPF